MVDFMEKVDQELLCVLERIGHAFVTGMPMSMVVGQTEQGGNAEIFAHHLKYQRIINQSTTGPVSSRPIEGARPLAEAY